MNTIFILHLDCDPRFIKNTGDTHYFSDLSNLASYLIDELQNTYNLDKDQSEVYVNYLLEYNSIDDLDIACYIEEVELDK